MALATKEIHALMIESFGMSEVQQMLVKYGKSTDGNEEELRSRAMELSTEQDEEPRFNEFLLNLCEKRKDASSTTPHLPKYKIKSESKKVRGQLRKLFAKPRFTVEQTISIIDKFFHGDQLCNVDGDKNSIRISLKCPISKVRIVIPARGDMCEHIMCFDAETFFAVTEKTNKWECPICAKPIEPDGVQIDHYFEQALAELRIDSGNELEIYSDFGWCPVLEQPAQVPIEATNEEVVILEEVKKREKSKGRHVEKEPVTENPVPVENMMVVVEIND